MATSENQQFIRDRRRDLKKAKQILGKLRCGCLCEDLYGKDTGMIHHAIQRIGGYLEIIDKITKKRV